MPESASREWGVCSPRGVSAPGGNVCSWGDVCFWGSVCFQGGWYPSMHWGRPPPVNRITDTSKNITLATTSLRPVNMCDLEILRKKMVKLPWAGRTLKRSSGRRTKAYCTDVILPAQERQEGTILGSLTS